MMVCPVYFEGRQIVLKSRKGNSKRSIDISLSVQRANGDTTLDSHIDLLNHKRHVTRCLVC